MSRILQESMQRSMQRKLNPWKALEKYQSEYISVLYTSTHMYCPGPQLPTVIPKEERGILRTVLQLES